MTLTQELKTYSFTDEQIDFILDIITNNAQYEDDEELGAMDERIVPTN
jgi:hypothetical protein